MGKTKTTYLLTLSELADLVHAAKCAKFPNVPAKAVPRRTFNDTTANGLTAAILAFLTLQPGCMAYRANSAAVYDQRKKTYRAGTITRGTADIMATVQGQTWAIEVKAGNDRMSAHQQRFKQCIEAAGGLYMVVRSFADFMATWSQLQGAGTGK